MDYMTLGTILLWGIFVGTIFSTIGAAGGILTSFGLITIFGVAEPNSVKLMTQIIVLSTALAFIPGYLRRSAVVLPLGLFLGGGGLIGAYLGSTISSLYLSDMQTFKPLFGFLTLAIAGQIAWKLFHQRKVATEAGGLAKQHQKQTVSQTIVSYKSISFSSGGESYNIPLWSPILAGMIISMVAAIFGVGGGFLLVPFLSTVLCMPMHIIPATVAIAIFMSLVVSISNFFFLGAPIQFEILVPLGVGAVIGAIIGPQINKLMKDNWLQAGLAFIVTGIGLKYIFL